MAEFKAAMAKLQVLGQNTRKLIDCSDVVPVPQPFTGHIKFPASFSKKDLQLAVSDFLLFLLFTNLNLCSVPLAIPQHRHRCWPCPNYRACSWLIENHINIYTT